MNTERSDNFVKFLSKFYDFIATSDTPVAIPAAIPVAVPAAIPVTVPAATSDVPTALDRKKNIERIDNAKKMNTECTDIIRQIWDDIMKIKGGEVQLFTSEFGVGENARIAVDDMLINEKKNMMAIINYLRICKTERLSKNIVKGIIPKIKNEIMEILKYKHTERFEHYMIITYDSLCDLEIRLCQ